MGNQGLGGSGYRAPCGIRKDGKGMRRFGQSLFRARVPRLPGFSSAFLGV
jgi:hypothetical protein